MSVGFLLFFFVVAMIEVFVFAWGCGGRGFDLPWGKGIFVFCVWGKGLCLLADAMLGLGISCFFP